MEYFDFGEELNILERDAADINEFRRYRSKIYKSRLDPMMEYDEREIRKKYRFSKENMTKIINLVKDDINVDTRGGGIPVHIQVMAVIRHSERREIQDDSGDLHGISQPTMSRLCKRVGRALARRSAEYMAVIRHSERREIQDDSGDLHGISQPTMSRLCKRVGRALARRSAEYIKNAKNDKLTSS